VKASPSPKGKGEGGEGEGCFLAFTGMKAKGEWLKASSLKTGRKNE
jgi:hypothetical protein